MSVAARPFVIGGSALIASSLIAVTPVVAPPDLHRVSTQLCVWSMPTPSSTFRTTSSPTSSTFPYMESQALAEYAYALGPAGSIGGVEGWIPPGATVADGGVDAQRGLIHRGRDRQLVDGIHRQHVGLG